MSDFMMIAIALVVGVPVLVAVMKAVAGDGYGRGPLPRSHRDEEELTQHEQLRWLVR